MKNTTRGTVEMTAAMIISGTIGWFVVVSEASVFDVVFWRCVFGAITLAIVCGAMGLLRGLSWRVFLIAALGGVAIVVNWLLLFAAYPRASIAIATTVYNTQPFMLTALGMLLFHERPPLLKLLWLVVAFAGVLLVIDSRGGASGSDHILGIALALGAAFFYAPAAIAAKALTGTPPHLVALIQVCVGTLMLAPLADLAHPPTEASSWGVLLVVGIVHTGLMYILLYGAIQRLPTYLIGALSFIYPLVAILVDVVAFGRQLSPAQAVGGTAILIAAAGATLGWSFAGLRHRSKETLS